MQDIIQNNWPGHFKSLVPKKRKLCIDEWREHWSNLKETKETPETSSTIYYIKYTQGKMKKCVYGWGFRQCYRSIVNFLGRVDDTVIIQSNALFLGETAEIFRKEFYEVCNLF